MNRLKELEAQVLEEGREWTRLRLKSQMQAHANEFESICPQNGCLLKYRQTRALTLETCVGAITIQVTSGYSKALKRRVHPVRAAWNLAPHQRISPELQDRLAYTATQTNSYQKASKLAKRWGTPISDDTVHAVVQRMGEAAEAIELPPPQGLKREEFSLVIMMDGWMVRRRGANWGADKRQHAAERVEWKEIKSAVIYRLETRTANASGRGLLVEKFVVASPPETSPLDFGAAVQAEALRRGLVQARQVYVVIDGAVWLWNLAKDRFSEADLLLDFHHASQHLWALANQLHGQGSIEARTWAEGLLHSLRHGGEAQVVRTLEELLIPKTPLAEPAPESLCGPVEYFRTHRDHLHYQRNAEQGAPVGSGSVESLCSQLQNRFKRTGQFWTPDGLRRLLKLDVLNRNDDFNCLWN